MLCQSSAGASSTNPAHPPQQRVRHAVSDLLVLQVFAANTQALAYFPDLELVTLDGAVSVRSTADYARFAVSGRSKLHSMALYAAEANGTYDLIRNPDFAVYSSQEAFQTFSSLQEVNDGTIDRYIATSLAERALVGYELLETQGHQGRERV